MNLSKRQLDDIASNLDLDDDDVRTDYSGRDMYRKTCVGFVISDATKVLELGAILFVELGRVPMAREDPMGLDSIIYFPDLHVDGEAS